MARVKVLVAVLAVFLGNSEGTFVPCVPDDCSQDGTTEGTKVADPTDCYQYYVCSDPTGNGTDFIRSSEPLTCPDGTWFNRNPSNGKDPACTTVPSGGLEGVCEPCNPCAVECGGDASGTLIPDPYDCTGFYHCPDHEGGDLSYFSCLPDEVFVYQLQSCVANGTCYDACDPCGVYCTKEGRATNPTDCTTYYYCEPDSVPDMVVFPCGEGSFYNRLTQVCEEGVCENTCPPAP